MIALMTLDIAFLKSFEVEWEAPISALENGEGADDDDDESMDLDTSSWVVTDPGSEARNCYATGLSQHMFGEDAHARPLPQGHPRLRAGSHPHAGARACRGAAPFIPVRRSLRSEAATAHPHQGQT